MEPRSSANCAIAGRAVTVVFYSDGEPRVIQAQVGKGQPFAIEAKEAALSELEKESKIVILLHEAGTVHKAEAKVTASSVEDGLYRLELHSVFWQESDRRRYPRYGFKIPITLRVVTEQNDGTTHIREVRGETEDISLGGAWVKTKDLVERGALVEFRAILTETESVRALAVVVHSNPARNGMGIEFLDYVGGARYHLHTFLSRAA